MNTFKVMTQNEMEAVNGGMMFLPRFFAKMMLYFIKTSEDHGRCAPRNSRYEYTAATRVISRPSQNIKRKDQP